MIFNLLTEPIIYSFPKLDVKGKYLKGKVFDIILKPASIGSL